MTRIKKTIISLLLIISVLPLMSGCNNSKYNTQPDVLQVRNITNLATLECYYHNVAKGTKKPGTGILSVGEKERKFWVEYTGIVKLGIDISLVDMDINENNITITLPPAKVLGVTIDPNSWNTDSIITSEDGINSNKIESADVTTAINEAQAKMESTAISNSTMLNNAQIRAKTLIENYINRIGEITGTEYTIIWNYLPQTNNE